MKVSARPALFSTSYFNVPRDTNCSGNSPFCSLTPVVMLSGGLLISKSFELFFSKVSM